MFWYFREYFENVEFNLKCENINQKDERYWTKVYRGQGEQDAGVVKNRIYIIL